LLQVMCRISDTDRLLPVPVSPQTLSLLRLLTNITGSGCIAALEAEKFLAEQDAEVENDLDQEKNAAKGNNVVVPEYRSNPLL
jgi:glutamine synthetase